eukprot:TRINITY_DN4550_c0_g1_i2.p1 TRINITY_DN4550_c0_g1~~TRINITY_DN4550_c0_g1_i2.p1  ORF type:complete len:453 (+),score=99.52 TRINITY_DN4550_c0_g1_i2:75-1433(+)
MGILKPVTVIALLLKAVVLGATRVLKQTLTRYRPDSIFLRAGYAPVSTELDRSSLRVIGTIPADLRGMFVRTGPNPQFHPIADYHWFDGDGMLHGVQFSDEGCRYVNRFVRTTRYLYEKKLGKAFFYGLMQFSNLFLVIYHSVRQAIGKQSRLGAKPLDGAANTSVELHAGRFFALHEASLPYQVQLPNLETLKQFDFDGKLKHQMTAHPKVDLETGEMFFFGYNLRSKPYLNYSYARKDGTLVATLPIDLEVPVMMHDFAVSKRYAIFMDLPLTFDVKRIVRDRPVIEFEPERGSRFGILPRTASTGSEIRWFKSPACFVYHTAGAYEEGDDVVLVASRLEKAQVFGLDKQSLEAYPEFMSKPYMWRFNMKTGAVTEGVIADVVADFPRIHPELLCKKFTFAYFAGLETCVYLTFDVRCFQYWNCSNSVSWNSLFLMTAAQGIISVCIFLF